MKKQIIRLALSLCGAIGLLASCGKDEPVKPTNEIFNKLHGTPFEATYTLTEATLSTPEVFEGNPKPSDITLTGQTQTLLYKATEERGWHIADESPSKTFEVKRHADAPNTVYVLTIEYRNAEGKTMNSEFIDNGQDKIHQHFFTYYRAGLHVKDRTKLPYDYRYLDTTPWDNPSGAFTGAANPIGFRGLLRFSGEKDFMLNADLIHAFETKYEADGTVSPFYAPSARLRAASDQDVSVKLPFSFTNEQQGHDHDHTPTSATYTLTEATLSSAALFDANPKLSDATPIGQAQTMLYKLIEGQGWQLAEESPSTAFEVKRYADAPNTVYILGIEYRNAEGEVINAEFVEDGEDKHHQHFFTYYTGGVQIKDRSKLPYDYRYADTDPLNNPSGMHIGDKNPIGFRGLIRFTGDKPFSLNADFVHAFETKYEVDGTVSPFYAPSARLRAASDLDISVQLPVKIMTTLPSTTDEKIADGEYGKLNTTEAVKMVIKMYEGHLHKTADPKVHSFHYVAGPTVPTPNLRMEQELVFLYKDGVWRSAENTTYAVEERKDDEGETILVRGPKTLHLERLFFKGSKKYGNLPAPIYGCWIEYYDVQGNKLNGMYTTPGAYQHFFTLSQVEPLGKTPLGGRQTSELMDYIYKDTTPWDLSAAKEGAKYAEKPLGLKGYFDFIASGFKARLNIELRRGGSSADFHKPAGGEPILRVSIPIYVPFRIDDFESFAYLDEDATWEDLSSTQQEMGDVLISALKMSGRDELVKSMLHFYNGQRGGENTGAWF